MNSSQIYTKQRYTLLLVFGIFALFVCTVSYAEDLLPSWNDGAAKTAILEFVAAVTDENGKDYVEPSERVAPSTTTAPCGWNIPCIRRSFSPLSASRSSPRRTRSGRPRSRSKHLLEGDMKTVGASGKKGIVEILMASHTGMTAEEFEPGSFQLAGDTKHPKFDRLYSECIYQPQLELLAYLRANGFKTFIVSAVASSSCAPSARRTTAFPREHVVGSSGVAEFQVQDGKGVIVRQPKVNFINDKAGQLLESMNTSVAARSLPSETRTATYR